MWYFYVPNNLERSILLLQVKSIKTSHNHNAREFDGGIDTKIQLQIAKHPLYW